MTIEERLREAFYVAYDTDEQPWAIFQRELAARGITACEAISGEPSDVTASPGNQKSGDVPTGNEGMQTAHRCSGHVDESGSYMSTSEEKANSDNGLAMSTCVDREQAIARELRNVLGISEEEASAVARAVIAADPWTQEVQEYVLHKTTECNNLRAEVERLRGALKHLSRAVSGRVYFADHSSTDVADYTRKALTEKHDG